jgi:hypothetical protein
MLANNNRTHTHNIKSQHPPPQERQHSIGSLYRKNVNRNGAGDRKCVKRRRIYRRRVVFIYPSYTTHTIRHPYTHTDVCVSSEEERIYPIDLSKRERVTLFQQTYTEYIV